MRCSMGAVLSRCGADGDSAGGVVTRIISVSGALKQHLTKETSHMFLPGRTLQNHEQTQMEGKKGTGTGNSKKDNSATDHLEITKGGRATGILRVRSK